MGTASSIGRSPGLLKFFISVGRDVMGLVLKGIVTSVILPQYSFVSQEGLDNPVANESVGLMVTQTFIIFALAKKSSSSKVSSFITIAQSS